MIGAPNIERAHIRGWFVLSDRATVRIVTRYGWRVRATFWRADKRWTLDPLLCPASGSNAQPRAVLLCLARHCAGCGLALSADGACGSCTRQCPKT